MNKSAQWFPVATLAALLLLVPGSRAPAQTDAQGQSEIAKVETTYDRTRDETTVEFRQLPLRGNDTQQVVLSVSAIYKGQKPKEPEDINFIISVLSTGSYRYPDIMSMKVLADGKKLPDVLMLNLDKRKADETYIETIGTRMKYDLFRQLLKATSVELQLKNLALPLNQTELAKLRELDALLR